MLEAGLPADQGWRIERSVITSAKGTDIDHVVVDPTGVFTINTNPTPGKNFWVSPVQFLVDGPSQDYLRKPSREAMRADQCSSAACGYSIHVQSVMVVVGAASYSMWSNTPRVESADNVVA